MNKNLIAFFIGLLAGVIAVNVILAARQDDGHLHSHDDEGRYHVHADFSFIINNNKIALSDKEYMSVSERILHPGAHLHDENGDVIHFHERDITLVEFLDSLGIQLEKSCVSLAGEKHCDDTESSLKLYVNQADQTESLSTYVVQDEDQILLYFGKTDDTNIVEHLEEIKDESCLYSGTCPERGVAPPESCGLTCEI